MKLNKLLPLLLVTSGITACSSIDLNDNAKGILVSRSAPPKGCEFVTQIAGNQGNFFTGMYTSNENLEVGSMNDLRNKAADQGANYVQLISDRAGVTGSGGGGGYSSAQTNVTNLGNAYKCPKAALAQTQ